MATVAPWHSRNTIGVYHLRDDCPKWNSEVPENHIPGVGNNNRLCLRCFLLLTKDVSEGMVKD